MDFGYILKAEPTEFSCGLQIGCHRKREVKSYCCVLFFVFNMSKRIMELPLNKMRKTGRSSF